MISIVIISKDEPALDATLAAVGVECAACAEETEVVVVDASAGRLDGIRERHPRARWIDFTPPAGVRISIPHQRNAGVRAAEGDVVVFTDAGCVPRRGWLDALTAAILTGEETVTSGIARGEGAAAGIWDSREEIHRAAYLRECPTINLAFTRAAFDAVGGFDERFEYGSDMDFSWRLVDAGHRIRSIPEAVVSHDWGTGRRRLRRSFRYGKARARLYRKHRDRIPQAVRSDPMVWVYPVFLLGLPLTLRFPLYPALLLIPAWRNRADGPADVIVDHLAFGAGVLAEVVRR